jgi:hypothetical protein
MDLVENGVFCAVRAGGCSRNWLRHQELYFPYGPCLDVVSRAVSGVIAVQLIEVERVGW